MPQNDKVQITFKVETRTPEEVRAADLPEGSVIEHSGMKVRHRGALALPPGWRGDNGKVYGWVEVDWMLAEGAQVLRVGNGQKG